MRNSIENNDYVAENICCWKLPPKTLRAYAWIKLRAYPLILDYRLIKSGTQTGYFYRLLTGVFSEYSPAE